MVAPISIPLGPKTAARFENEFDTVDKDSNNQDTDGIFQKTALTTTTDNGKKVSLYTIEPTADQTFKNRVYAYAATVTTSPAVRLHIDNAVALLKNPEQFNIAIAADNQLLDALQKIFELESKEYEFDYFAEGQHRITLSFDRDSAQLTEKQYSQFSNFIDFLAKAAIKDEINPDINPHEQPELFARFFVGPKYGAAVLNLYDFATDALKNQSDEEANNENTSEKSTYEESIEVAVAKENSTEEPATTPVINTTADTTSLWDLCQKPRAGISDLYHSATQTVKDILSKKIGNEDTEAKNESKIFKHKIEIAGITFTYDVLVDPKTKDVRVKLIPAVGKPDDVNSGYLMYKIGLDKKGIKERSEIEIAMLEDLAYTLAQKNTNDAYLSVIGSHLDFLEYFKQP